MRTTHPGRCACERRLHHHRPARRLRDPHQGRRATAASSSPCPIVLWQLWRFITPGPAPEGEAYAIPFIAVVGRCCSLFGALIAYFTLPLRPRVPDQLLAAPTSTPAFTPEHVRQPASMLMMLAFGVGFVFPVLLVFLQLVGVLTPQQLLEVAALRDRGHRGRRRRHHAERRPVQHARPGHPDVRSSTRCSIVIGWLINRRQAQATARAAAWRRLTGQTGAVGASAGRDALLARYDFPLDRFQLQAHRRPRRRPVGARRRARPARARRWSPSTPSPGRSRRAGGPSTPTPIKALSNQKFHDLVGVHGAEQVGLLTGDNTINGDAPVVVMTTEVLRNMIYGRSARARRPRRAWCSTRSTTSRTPTAGPVWEEVIIHLPADVRLVCLSATVSNAEELADWITTVRGPTAAIVEERRPVELENLYLVGDTTRPSGCTCCPTLVDGRPNPEAAGLDGEARPGLARQRPPAGPAPALHAAAGRGGRAPRRRGHAAGDLLHLQPQRRATTPPRPASTPGLRLTDRRRARPHPRDRRRAPRRRSTTDDLAVLGYGQLPRRARGRHRRPPRRHGAAVQGGGRGAASSRAWSRWCSPPRRSPLGINMPARTVVIEKLTKFTGEHHDVPHARASTPSSPGGPGGAASTTSGYAVVLWSPFVPFDQVAALAVEPLVRTCARRSGPTYNMAANLVRSYTGRAGPPPAQPVVRPVPGRPRRRAPRGPARARARRVLAELRGAAASPYGDIDEYRRLAGAERIAER